MRPQSSRLGLTAERKQNVAELAEDAGFDRVDEDVPAPRVDDIEVRLLLEDQAHKSTIVRVRRLDYLPDPDDRDAGLNGQLSFQNFHDFQERNTNVIR